jgi:dsRNA-specific ribonuclease
VIVGDQTLAQGAGRTKKEAEQEGARLALAEIAKTE